MPGYYEPASELDAKTRAISHAINTLIEELEAVDYYNQRVSTCTDADLKEIMAHNRGEEIEHACMTIEWLRRNMDRWDKELSDYLFTTGNLLQLENAATGTEAGAPASEASGLGIGKNR